MFGIVVKENSQHVSSWSREHGLTYPLIPDLEGEIYRQFGTGSVPYHVVIDKELVIRHSEEKFDKVQLIDLLNGYF